MLRKRVKERSSGFLLPINPKNKCLKIVAFIVALEVREANLVDSDIYEISLNRFVLKRLGIKRICMSK